jgi:hypothetical protein
MFSVFISALPGQDVSCSSNSAHIGSVLIVSHTRARGSQVSRINIAATVSRAPVPKITVEENWLGNNA